MAEAIKTRDIETMKKPILTPAEKQAKQDANYERLTGIKRVRNAVVESNEELVIEADREPKKPTKVVGRRPKAKQAVKKA